MAAPAARPEWCTVPEPVVQERDWDYGETFYTEDNVDRTDIGWNDLKVLSEESIADTAEGRVVKEELINKLDGRVHAFMLYNVLSEEECLEIIDACNEKQFTPALVNTGRGRQQYLPDYRSGLRCIADSPKFSQLLFNRIAPFLPKAMQGMELFNFNERMRVLCYHHPDNRFETHMDGRFQHPTTDAISVYTLQLYLNTIPDAKVDGGGTAFTDDGQVVTPQTGSVLCFTQNLSHEGQALLTGGIKYTIRTEAMYRDTDDD
eukprot:TRINITY_DN5763_c0_g3_i2.p1 TRINITY_DN5763_c0_g3~~TRINITY_DN5763_c0_g3_i2.p1  ORF type:complete len:261 (+),score=99.30 TRINITY_DN5763_c0_g3_i2:127-909(+)